MTTKIASLVQEISTTTGTGNLTLAVSSGYRTFDTAFGNGATTNVFYYFITDTVNNAWEFGTGHMSNATTLVRDTILGSSSANAAVNFLGGTITIINDLRATEQVAVEDFAGLMASSTHTATSKTTPVGADEFFIADSGAAFGIKKLTYTNLLATLSSVTYTSPDQVITAGGALTLSHGLAVKPKHVHVILNCITAEDGFSIGDDFILAYGNQGNNQGVSIVPDATNLNIRYGSAAATFSVINKTTGASISITNANWKVRFEATGDL